MIPVINNMCGMQATPYSLPYMKNKEIKNEIKIK